jgi:DNA-directed RNA polymerase specialized sigma24 family protein
MTAPAFSISPRTTRLGDPALREALLRYAQRRVPAGEAEDLVQNTLTEALSSSSAPEDPGELYRWVHGIARHKIADTYRRRARSLPLDDAEPSTHDPEPEARELGQWIERELPKTRDARATLDWLLREEDGERLDEIARDVALRVSRLRRHFHERWLALGAAGLALLLAAAWLLHTRASDSVPPIARETVKSSAPIVAPVPSELPAAPVPSAYGEHAPSKALPKKQLPLRKVAPTKNKPAPEQFAPQSKSNAIPQKKL